MAQGRQCSWWWKRGGGGDCMRKIAWLPQTSVPPTAKSKRGGQQAAGGWGWIGFCGESNRSSVAASVLHLPPSSVATTTNLARPPPTSSGYVLSLALLAMRSAAPAFGMLREVVFPCRCYKTRVNYSVWGLILTLWQGGEAFRMNSSLLNNQVTGLATLPFTS